MHIGSCNINYIWVSTLFHHGPANNQTRLYNSTLIPQPWTFTYSKTYVKRGLSKRPKHGFHDRLSLIAGQKYCRMLQREHSAILLTFIKLPVVIKTFVLSILSGRFTHVLLYMRFWYIYILKVSRACTSWQTRQSLHFSHAEKMEWHKLRHLAQLMYGSYRTKKCF